MLQEFLQFIKEQKLFASDETVLLAVSGGMDSVAMCHLFRAAGFRFGIAHCNFQLRSTDSEKDEQFVKELARNLGVKVYIKKFDTEEEAKKDKSSIQMLARTLRYEWFEDLRQSHDFDYIATAHHSNDAIETMLYNFTKGCGIKGLHGILPKKKRLIRPLLFSNKLDIEQYIIKNKYAYREDESNLSEKYIRNKIRHQIIPVLQSINPTLEKNASSTFRHIQEAEILFDEAIARIKNEIIIQKKPHLVIDFQKVKIHPARQTILFEIIAEFGFNGSQIKQLFQSKTVSGNCFYSPTHQLLKNRNELIVSPGEEKKAIPIIILKTTKKIAVNGGKLLMKWLKTPPDTIPNNNNIAILDAQKIEFPLQLRNWEPGDFFHPLGMKGKRKKLKDFFTDKKLSLLDKTQVQLIISGNKICWIIAYRADERFKITPQTTSCLAIQFIPE